MANLKALFENLEKDPGFEAYSNVKNSGDLFAIVEEGKRMANKTQQLDLNLKVGDNLGCTGLEDISRKPAQIEKRPKFKLLFWATIW